MGRSQKTLLVAVSGLLLLTGLALGGSRLVNSSSAQAPVVGSVDVARLSNEYLKPELDEPLKKEADKLQKELDEKVKGLSDDAKQRLLQQYQGVLDSRKQEMIDKILPKVNKAIAAVAQEQGIGLVLDKQSVLYGGKDLTEPVLLKLGVKTGK
ncbi:MAG: OmpH family outer membrane protein [Firmicutes bacterium]|nr:OmpH family outer membrane protein [Bacillota bacterium]